MNSHRFSIVRCLAAGMVISAAVLTGCSGSNTSQSSTDSNKPVVATTFTVLADIVKNIAGDHMDVVSITKPGAEIHEYEPTPGDIATASKANLVIDNGLGLESWFEKFIAEVNVPHVVASDGIDVINISEDAAAGKPNPHAWMSPSNVKIYVDNITTALSDLDPEHADEYAANALTYKEKLDNVRSTMLEKLDTLPENQRALVTCEGAFSYLAQDAGLTEKYLWAVNSENQATPGQIASAIDFVNENQIPAVFCESTVSDAAMQQVVSATNAAFGGTLYVDSLSEEGGAVPTYLDLIAHDATTITEALTRNSSN